MATNKKDDSNTMSEIKKEIESAKTNNSSNDKTVNKIEEALANLEKEIKNIEDGKKSTKINEIGKKVIDVKESTSDEDYIPNVISVSRRKRSKSHLKWLFNNREL